MHKDMNYQKMLRQYCLNAAIALIPALKENDSLDAYISIKDDIADGLLARIKLFSIELLKCDKARVKDYDMLVDANVILNQLKSKTNINSQHYREVLITTLENKFSRIIDGMTYLGKEMDIKNYKANHYNK